MKDRIVHLAVSSPAHQENLCIVAKDFNEFSQLLYAWLNHEKIGSDFRLVNNAENDNDVYWLDAGDGKEGFVSVKLQACSSFAKDEEIAFGKAIAQKNNADIFTNEQEHPLIRPEKAMQLNAIKELKGILVPFGFPHAVEDLF